MITEQRLDDFRKLPTFNFIVGLLYFLQGIFILIAAFTIENVKGFKLLIEKDSQEWIPPNYPDEGFFQIITTEVFQIPAFIWVAIVLLLGAIIHFAVNGQKLNPYYNSGLQKGVNKFRWFETSIANAVMLVIVASLFRVTDINIIVLIFALSLATSLIGLLMELDNEDAQNTKWTPFIVQILLNIILWIVIFNVKGAITAPSEMLAFGNKVFIVIFIATVASTVNMFLQHKKSGKWKQYIYGEKIIMTLNLITRSLITWIMFFEIMKA